MKRLVLQLMVTGLGCFALVYGEIKHYIDSHPSILSTLQLEAKKAEPLQYFVYHGAYDPNTGKVWYFYNDGYWYDKPPQIRKSQNQSQKALGTINGSQGGSTGYNHGQSAQTPTNTTRY